LGALGRPAGAADSLESVLARLDKVAPSFKTLTANIKRTQHTELVNANETDEGTIAVKRFKADDIRILINFTKPEPKKISIGQGKGQVYYPKANEVQVADVKKHRDLVNEVLLLSFGATSAELKSAYTITLGGPDTVNGVPATRIELVAKSEEIRRSIKKCELWIPENGVVVQQKFHESGGDYQLTTYSNMVMNPNLPDAAVRLDPPKGVKVTNLK
jgi:outer membrane lipoprotein-sorting protein